LPPPRSSSLQVGRHEPVSSLSAKVESTSLLSHLVAASRVAANFDLIALLQRVTQARVEVDNETVGAIGAGLLVFVGVERDDTESDVSRLLDRILRYRVFADIEGRMNKSIADVAGGLLFVPQFTLAADTHKGTRPSFSPAAPPEKGKTLFDYLVTQAKTQHTQVATGRFGAYMRVHLLNDGPVTLLLRSPPSHCG
jgi:D-tyrosyl-tRNA(Tyr) deacylase